MRRLFPTLLALISSSLAFAADPTWQLAHTQHFAVYAQGPEQRARSILLRFEQLRAFFLEQTAFGADQAVPVVVIAFNSAKEYDPYRLGPAADAYFASADESSYIVMATGASPEFGIAAHEYAHLVLHTNGAHLPPWLSEGLAEFFSTIQIAEQ